MFAITVRFVLQEDENTNRTGSSTPCSDNTTHSYSSNLLEDDETNGPNSKELTGSLKLTAAEIKAMAVKKLPGTRNASCNTDSKSTNSKSSNSSEKEKREAKIIAKIRAKCIPSK